MSHLLAVARGETKADLVFQNATVIDLVNGGEIKGNVAIAGDWIAGIGDYEGLKVIDCSGLTIVPGFIDSHLHIESSLMHPFEFEAQTLPLGTTTALCDPHAITNDLHA